MTAVEIPLIRHSPASNLEPLDLMDHGDSGASESLSQMTDEHLHESPAGSRFPRGESAPTFEARPGAINVAFDIAGEAMASRTDAEISGDWRTLCLNSGEYRGFVLGPDPASNQRLIENFAARSVGPEVERVIQTISRIIQETLVSYPTPSCNRDLKTYKTNLT